MEMVERYSQLISIKDRTVQANLFGMANLVKFSLRAADVRLAPTSQTRSSRTWRTEYRKPDKTPSRGAFSL